MICEQHLPIRWAPAVHPADPIRLVDVSWLPEPLIVNQQQAAAFIAAGLATAHTRKASR